MPKATSRSAKSRQATSRRDSRQVAPSDNADFGGIRVLCVDDHEILIEGLKARFAIDDRMRVVGCLANAENLLEETARLRPDIVLLDIEMPGPDVFEMADRLRHLHPKVRFMFLSAHIRDGYLAAAFKCGASAYFAKGDDLRDIVTGIADIARSVTGTFVMGPKVRARCSTAWNGPADTTRHSSISNRSEPVTPLSSLTAREVAVLRLIGKGLSRNEIADELSRTVKTVDAHQARMMKKLGLSSRADLMRFAIREGFAEA